MRILKYILISIIACVIVGSLVYGGVNAGWFSKDKEADEKESERVEQQQDIYVDSQPIPAFDWSLERHIFVELYKARNNAVTTYSYVRNWQGDVYFSCKSIGFPLPANMQLTNPERRIGDGYKGEIDTKPQPEPNGLFTSPSSVGTYIFCVNDDGSVSPSYFEDRVETHLSPLKENENGLKGDGELKIKIDNE